jgi:hypothetical protein
MALQHAIVSPEAVNTEVEGVFDRPLGFEGGRAAGGGAAVPCRKEMASDWANQAVSRGELGGFARFAESRLSVWACVATVGWVLVGPASE